MYIAPPLPLTAEEASRGSLSRGGASSSAFRFPDRSVGGLHLSIEADSDTETDEDASWGAGSEVSGAQERAGSVRVVGRKLLPRSDDERAGLLSLSRFGRSQGGLGMGSPADARVDGVGGVISGGDGIWIAATTCCGAFGMLSDGGWGVEPDSKAWLEAIAQAQRQSNDWT